MRVVERLRPVLAVTGFSDYIFYPCLFSPLGSTLDRKSGKNIKLTDDVHEMLNRYKAVATYYSYRLNYPQLILQMLAKSILFDHIVNCSRQGDAEECLREALHLYREFTRRQGLPSFHLTPEQVANLLMCTPVVAEG